MRLEPRCSRAKQNTLNRYEYTSSTTELFVVRAVTITQFIGKAKQSEISIYLPLPYF